MHKLVVLNQSAPRGACSHASLEKHGETYTYDIRDWGTEMNKLIVKVKTDILSVDSVEIETIHTCGSPSMRHHIARLDRGWCLVRDDDLVAMRLASQVEHLVLGLDEALALVLGDTDGPVEHLNGHHPAVHPEGSLEAQAVHEPGEQLGGAEHVDGGEGAADARGVGPVDEEEEKADSWET